MTTPTPLPPQRGRPSRLFNIFNKATEELILANTTIHHALKNLRFTRRPLAATYVTQRATSATLVRDTMPASLTNPAKAATDYDFSRQSKPAYRNAWVRAVCGDETITGTSNHVAHLVNYFVNSKSGLCCPAQDTLARTGGISVSTVKRSLTTLEQAGYIHRVKAV